MRVVFEKTEQLMELIEKIDTDFPESIYTCFVLPDGTLYEAYDSKQLGLIATHLRHNLDAIMSKLAELN